MLKFPSVMFKEIKKKKKVKSKRHSSSISQPNLLVPMEWIPPFLAPSSPFLHQCTSIGKTNNVREPEANYELSTVLLVVELSLQIEKFIKLISSAILLLLVGTTALLGDQMLFGLIGLTPANKILQSSRQAKK